MSGELIMDMPATRGDLALVFVGIVLIMCVLALIANKGGEE